MRLAAIANELFGEAAEPAPEPEPFVPVTREQAATKVIKDPTRERHSITVAGVEVAYADYLACTFDADGPTLAEQLNLVPVPSEPTA